jgi:hypothetical protein
VFVVAVVLICGVVPAFKALRVVVVFQSKSMMCFYLCIQPSHNGANTRDKKESKFIRSEYSNHRRRHGEEATLRSAEEEEEKGERRARFGNGAVEAWTDEVVDRVGVAS